MHTRARVTAIPALLAAGCAATLPFGLKVAAHQVSATPDAVTDPYADLGLPGITLDFTSAAISGMPESLEAGRYLVTINGEPTEDDFGFGTLFLRLPEGMTLEDAMAEAGASQNGPPAFLFESLLPGGPSITLHSGLSTAHAVIDLEPGDWLVAGSALAQPPVPFTVSGELPGDLPEPESTVTFSLGEMAIKITEGELSAGDNLLRIDNTGTQVHQIEVEKLPEGTTRSTIEHTLEMEMGGTPSADILDFSQVRFLSISGYQSPGTTMWMPLTLEPGTYGIFCFLPDPETGMPHAHMGMWDMFEVTA